MNIDESLYKYLSTYAGLTALINTKVYPLVVPQDVALPAVTYQRISDPPEHAMGKDATIYHPRYQISCWATTYTGVQSLAAQIKAALTDYSSAAMGGTGGENVYRVFYEGCYSDYDSNTGQYRETLDFIIWHD